MLVLPYMPNSPNIITITSIFTAGAAFSGILYFLLLTLFSTITVVVNILYSEI